MLPIAAGSITVWAAGGSDVGQTCGHSRSVCFLE